MDLELSKYIKTSIILIGLSVIINGCYSSKIKTSIAKKDEPAWITKNELPFSQATACHNKNKNYNNKQLEKIVFAKAKLNYIFKQKVIINSTTHKKDHEFKRSSIQGSHFNFEDKDFNIIEKFKNKTKLCLLIEYRFK